MQKYFKRLRIWRCFNGQDKLDSNEHNLEDESETEITKPTKLTRRHSRSTVVEGLKINGPGRQHNTCCYRSIREIAAENYTSFRFLLPFLKL